jgi:hypothetical protein
LVGTDGCYLSTVLQYMLIILVSLMRGRGREGSVIDLGGVGSGKCSTLLVRKEWYSSTRA